jgi:hypothetical protein
MAVRGSKCSSRPPTGGTMGGVLQTLRCLREKERAHARVGNRTAGGQRWLHTLRHLEVYTRAQGQRGTCRESRSALTLCLHHNTRLPDPASWDACNTATAQAMFFGENADQNESGRGVAN